MSSADGKRSKLPPTAWRLIENNDLVVSPMVLLELEYLYERRRSPEPDKVLEMVADTVGLRFSAAPHLAVVQAARSLKWCPDPFDRLIVANAIVDRAKLLTPDGRISEHFAGAVW
jgi:PIN domain nuclease of toxin-antitoxin system